MSRWMLGALCTAAALLAFSTRLAMARGEETPPDVQRVHEESKCQPILQEFNQMKLATLQINLETGEMRAVYARLLSRHLLVLWLYVRQSCTEPMALVKTSVVDPNPRECPEGSSCL